MEAIDRERWQPCTGLPSQAQRRAGTRGCCRRGCVPRALHRQVPGLPRAPLRMGVMLNLCELSCSFALAFLLGWHMVRVAQQRSEGSGRETMRRWAGCSGRHGEGRQEMTPQAIIWLTGMKVP